MNFQQQKAKRKALYERAVGTTINRPAATWPYPTPGVTKDVVTENNDSDIIVAAVEAVLVKEAIEDILDYAFASSSGSSNSSDNTNTISSGDGDFGGGGASNSY